MGSVDGLPRRLLRRKMGAVAEAPPGAECNLPEWKVAINLDSNRSGKLERTCGRVVV